VIGGQQSRRARAREPLTRAGATTEKKAGEDRPRHDNQDPQSNRVKAAFHCGRGLCPGCAGRLGCGYAAVVMASSGKAQGFRRFACLSNPV